ncbi:unnamed protein product [Umbelopsis ramanniana]
MDSIGETELQSIYFDPMLASILSNPQQNVVLRWAYKNEEASDIRPDAVISTIVQSKYDRPLGFGEVKPGNSSTKKLSLCMDTLRLATLTNQINVPMAHFSRKNTINSINKIRQLLHKEKKNLAKCFRELEDCASVSANSESLERKDF